MFTATISNGMNANIMKDICHIVMLNEQRITLNVCVRPDITGAFIGKYNLN